MFTPNSNKSQIFYLKDKSIFFKYQINDVLLINLNSTHWICGFSWFTKREKDKVMFLRGRDNRLSLTTSKYRIT